MKKTVEQLGLPDSNSLQIEQKTSNSGIIHFVILAHCTSKLQPLNVSVNQPFKQITKGFWSEIVHKFLLEAADKAVKSRLLLNSKYWDKVVKGCDMMKKKRADSKSFQVTRIISTDPVAVRTVKSKEGEDDSELDDDFFADIELEQHIQYLTDSH